MSELDPTTRGDLVAETVRAWYEKNRETWWDRHRPGIFGAAPDRAGVHADNFILELIQAVHRTEDEVTK